MIEILYNKAKGNNVDIIKSAYFTFNKISEKIYLNDLNIPENRILSISEFPVFFSKHPSIWSCLYKKVS